MPNFSMSVPHHLTQDEALRRIKNRLAQLKAQYSHKLGTLQEDWNGNVGTFSGSAAGSSASATLIVTPSEVIIQGTLPVIATFFSGKIEALIRKEMSTLLM